MHQVARNAVRAGTTEAVLGGRKVQIRRPRVRAGKNKISLPTFQALAATDPLNRRVVEQMLLGVATRQYARSLDPLPADVRTRGTSKSTVSRRFVAKTTAQVTAWQTPSLESLDLVALLIDGVPFGEHCLVVRLSCRFPFLAARTRGDSAPSSAAADSLGLAHPTSAPVTT